MTPTKADSDYTIFIAKHTSGGMAYGITWEQAELEGLMEEIEMNDKQ